MDPQVVADGQQAFEWVIRLFGNPDWTIVINLWKVYGLVGVLLFSGRWFVQLYYSRKAGKPVTPRLFWIMSMAGSAILLSYFLFSPKQDLVGVLSNLFPAFVAAYNLYLDLSHAKRVETQAAAQNGGAAAADVAPAAANK
jgi:lipid-A-disaccharide synthase-like uncharacterized protein